MAASGVTNGRAGDKKNAPVEGAFAEHRSEVGRQSSSTAVGRYLIVEAAFNAGFTSLTMESARRDAHLKLVL